MRTLSIAEIILAIYLISVFVYLTTGNLIMLIKRFKGIECGSIGPFLGGLHGTAALVFVLKKQYQWLFFIPLLLGYGCIPLFCEFIYLYTRYLLKKEEWYLRS